MVNTDEIKIQSISPLADRGALKAFAEIQVGPFSIVDCRIIQENGKKPWVSMPVLTYKNEQGTTRYKTLVQIIDKDLKNEITQAVLKAWDENGGGVNEFKTDN